MAPEEIEIAEVIRDMSTFEEVLTAAVLAMILGVIGNIIFEIWQKGSIKIKGIISASCVMAVVGILAFAWSLPRMPSGNRPSCG